LSSKSKKKPAEGGGKSSDKKGYMQVKKKEMSRGESMRVQKKADIFGLSGQKKLLLGGGREGLEEKKGGEEPPGVYKEGPGSFD